LQRENSSAITICEERLERGSARINADPRSSAKIRGKNPLSGVRSLLQYETLCAPFATTLAGFKLVFWVL